MRRLPMVFLALLLATLVARPAHAQTYFAPFIGYDFGGDAGSCDSIFADCSVKRTAYGFSVGRLSHGILGIEEEFAYAPDFFGTSPTFGSNSVLTLMTNLIVAIPAGPVHPYLSAGGGLVRTRIDTFGNLVSLGGSSFGWNVGGGVMVMLPSHLGFRVDYRHMRSSNDLSLAGVHIIGGSTLNYNRIAFALVLH